ncbi:MAG: FAD-dependent monooxygenase [Planctomycetes bacterium]|nr:FAD-dependent monooxygenase [Planctomycetota bacterium]
MSGNDTPEVVIVGGGPAGSLLANYLGKRGIHTDIYESRSDPRTDEQSHGRSINLALSYRGLAAMSPVGLTDRVMKMCVPMRGRMIHSKDGHLAFQSYGVDNAQAINSISRGGLNAAILDAASKYSSVRLLFNHKCTDVHLAQGEVAFTNTRTNESTIARGRVVVGADGAFSVIRRAMQKLDRFDFSQTYLRHGYKELTIPADRGSGFAIEKNALHIWPRRSFMMIALPNFDGSFTCTLFWPFEGANSFAAIQSKKELSRFFTEQFPDALPLMPNLAQEFFENPTGSMVTVRCEPWHCFDRAVLFGDACHAVVPFYGQGMNAAFEDVLVFAELMDQWGRDWGKLFREYEQLRKPNTDALANLAIENFVEMRDRTGSRRFRLKKKSEKFLGRWLRGWYIPLYTMVSFTRTPYAEAVRRARRQDALVAAGAFVVAVLLVTLLTAILHNFLWHC